MSGFQPNSVLPAKLEWHFQPWAPFQGFIKQFLVYLFWVSSLIWTAVLTDLFLFVVPTSVWIILTCKLFITSNGVSFVSRKAERQWLSKWRNWWKEWWRRSLRYHRSPPILYSALKHVRWAVFNCKCLPFLTFCTVLHVGDGKGLIPKNNIYRVPALIMFLFEVDGIKWL